ncbi:hypothetical protein ACKGJO_02150 [Gracilimonas sp. Q87]|uniref:hypothetical protein n=1 Tax=Gracilimonas sp. Q87 TaxID=3384766 RepID=UPI003983F934
MPSHSVKQRLIKKLQWTFQVEGMNAVMFFGILIFINAAYDFRDLIFLSYGLLMMSFILLQGTYYWWKKLSVLEDKHIFQNRTLNRFEKFRDKNKVGIALIPFVLLVQWFISGQSLGSDNFIAWALIANAFAVLEYINYYHLQLMYDNRYDLRYLLRHKKLKEASLRKDLRDQQI